MSQSLALQPPLLSTSPRPWWSLIGMPTLLSFSCWTSFQLTAPKKPPGPPHLRQRKRWRELSDNPHHLHSQSNKESAGQRVQATELRLAPLAAATRGAEGHSPQGHKEGPERGGTVKDCRGRSETTWDRRAAAAGEHIYSSSLWGNQGRKHVALRFVLYSCHAKKSCVIFFPGSVLLSSPWR